MANIASLAPETQAISSCGAGCAGECRLSERSRQIGRMAWLSLEPRHEHARETQSLPKKSPCVDMHQYGIMMHMRTTMILDDELIDEARRLTGLSEKTAIVHAGLEALIARESARRLANLGGSDVRATAPPRRRLAPRRGR